MNNPLIFDMKMDLLNILDYFIHGNENKITQIEESKSSGCSDNLVTDALQKQPPEMFSSKYFLRNFSKFTGIHLW